MQDFGALLQSVWKDFQPEGGFFILLSHSLFALLFFWGVQRLLLRLSNHRLREQPMKRYKWEKVISYSTSFLGILWVAMLWIGQFASLATFLGLLSAGIAIALREPVMNFAGWVFILARQPFKVGQRIEIAGHKGDVIDLRIFQFTLIEVGNWVHADQSTGRIIHIPNARALSESIANYNIGFNYIWHEVPILVTFESNWEAAKKIMTEVVERHTLGFAAHARHEMQHAAEKKFPVIYHKTTPIVYTSVADSGVLLTMRFLVMPKKRRATEQGIWEDILRAFGKRNDIDFAYPTQRFYNNRSEGKSNAGGAVPPEAPQE